MSKYAELDELILGKINGETPTPFHKIHLYDDTGLTSSMASMCDSLSRTGTDGFRVLDRRLQALRKAGKIKSIPGKGWVKLIEDNK